jgi:hypothetical protein
MLFPVALVAGLVRDARGGALVPVRAERHAGSRVSTTVLFGVNIFIPITHFLALVHHTYETRPVVFAPMFCPVDTLEA